MKNNSFKPKTPKGFDYALWRDDKRVPYARILSTGEVLTVSEEVFRFLRAEEKRYSRYILKNTIEEKDENGEVISTSSVLLSIDFVADSANDGGVWLIDKNNVEESIGVKLLIEEFEKELSELQVIVLNRCLLEGVPNLRIAKEIGVQEGTIRYAIKQIQIKAKKFF